MIITVINCYHGYNLWQQDFDILAKNKTKTIMLQMYLNKNLSSSIIEVCLSRHEDAISMHAVKNSQLYLFQYYRSFFVAIDCFTANTVNNFKDKNKGRKKVNATSEEIEWTTPKGWIWL